jgi:tetratricopeptide (TPR) repeat protein
MSGTPRAQVFISYAQEDLAMVRRLCADLSDRAVNVWLDKDQLRPGRWRSQIERAIARSRFFVICVSQSALRKTGEEPGFTDTELTAAYQIATAQDERSFTIVPVRLEDCGRGDHRLSVWQQFDLFIDWNVEVDRLAVLLGGRSLSETQRTVSFEETSQHDRTVTTLSGLAIASFYAGDAARAVRTLETVLELEPGSSAAWYNKGIALTDLGRYTEALEAFERAIAADRDNAEAWYSKGVALSLLNQPEGAFMALDRASELAPRDPQVWMNKGLALGQLGRHEDAVHAFDHLLSLGRRDLKTWHSRGVALFKLGRFEEALAAFDEALTLSPDDIESLYPRSVALGNLGRHQEALATLRRLTELDEHHSLAWHNKGIALSNLGRHDEAEAAFIRARSLAPERKESGETPA